MPLPTFSSGRFLVRVRTAVAGALLTLGARLAAALRIAATDEPAADVPSLPSRSVPVIVHFADAPPTLYQLEQWLPVFERAAERQPLLIVCRHAETARRLRIKTTLPVALAPSIDDLLDLYEKIDTKCVIYVNNGSRNFQSLIYPSALHVHVNHGESDKISMVSNQVKGYDRVVVAGQAAVERHRKALINFPTERLAVCGRPQLDLRLRSQIPPTQSGTRTVLYAPTWSGEAEANNYTSLDRYGVDIVRAALQLDEVRLVYKPHPRVVNGTDPACRTAHEEIRKLIRAADAAGGAHLMPFDADALAVLEGVDLLIGDISSIGLDFLYRHPESPIILTDRRSSREQLVAESPVAATVDIVDNSTVANVGALIRENLSRDPRQAARQEVRDYYFGFEPGESSARFLDFIDECIVQRDSFVEQRGQPVDG